MHEDLSPRARSLLMAIRRFGRVQMLHGGVMGASGLRPSEMFLLASVRKHDEGRGLKPSELSARLGVSPGNVTQLITSIEKSGYLRRSRDPDDRRAVRVHITEEGRQATDAAMKAVETAFSGLAEALGEAECDHFAALLDRASDHFGRAWGIDLSTGKFGVGMECPAAKELDR